jgi:hypothetical protein
VSQQTCVPCQGRGRRQIGPGWSICTDCDGQGFLSDPKPVAERKRKAPTKAELKVTLLATAIDLLGAARVKMFDLDEPARSGVICFQFAARAFAALELLGRDPFSYSSAREMVPWVGPWSSESRRYVDLAHWDRGAGRGAP